MKFAKPQTQRYWVAGRCTEATIDAIEADVKACLGVRAMNSQRPAP